ncbi:MAG: CopG family transcriptional regulator [Lachnospiraceae bacterium]|nr:CopG family transcriptional regulator [Lachnospiraceae bacterium]
MSNNKPLVIKRKGEDGSKIITIRIKEDILNKLDKMASESNFSRNELITTLLKYAIENTEIQK